LKLTFVREEQMLKICFLINTHFLKTKSLTKGFLDFLESSFSISSDSAIIEEGTRNVVDDGQGDDVLKGHDGVDRINQKN